jgi:hypothetical protein
MITPGVERSVATRIPVLVRQGQFFRVLGVGELARAIRETPISRSWS